MDVGTQLRLCESPLDIAEAMQARILALPSESSQSDGWPDAPSTGPGRAWIFTSATLGSDEQLTWFTERAGLQDAQILRVASPFHYPSQAALYVPGHLPPPKADPSHSRVLAQWVGGCCRDTGRAHALNDHHAQGLARHGRCAQGAFAACGARWRCWSRESGPSGG